MKALASSRALHLLRTSEPETGEDDLRTAPPGTFAEPAHLLKPD